MRIKLITLILFFLSTLSWAQSPPPDTLDKKKLRAEATVSLNSNGIAYIPAFSLDKPAIVGMFSLKKGRFSYDPALSYSLELRPWIIDNWFHYTLMDLPYLEIRAGAVISAFFSEYEAPEGLIHQAQKYLAGELMARYKFSPLSSLSFTYLADRGQDPGTLNGHFYNLQFDRSKVPLGKKGLLGTSLQVFYIDYTGDNDGLFVAGNISISLRKVPFAVFVQAIQALNSNIVPFPEFKWNVGLQYTL